MSKQLEFLAPTLPVSEFGAQVESVLITLILTERCNYRCDHCLYRCSPAKPAQYVSDEVLAQVAKALEVSQCGERTVLNLLGGEPTLDLQEFGRVLRWVTALPRHSFLLSMVTNGWWLQRLGTLAAVAKLLRPLWNEKDDLVRISISNTVWHDKFRTEKLKQIIQGRTLAQVLSDLERWYPDAEVADLSEDSRQAIAEMAEAAKREEIYVQSRTTDAWNLISTGRAEDNGFGRLGHLCSPEDMSITVWPDGSIRHICDGGGKFNFGHINQGIATIWALRREFLRRLHHRYPLPSSTPFFASSTRCMRCRQYAGYWLDRERPKLAAMVNS